MEEDIARAYRRQVEEEEEKFFHKKATLSKHHSRYFGPEDDHRLPYQRDVDRIVHSKAYARYADKTQVAYLVDNDHITHRSLHVQLVAHFAKGVAEILKLNTSLVEAIALGHDVGHPPFGHEGEGYLSDLAAEYRGNPFAHPWQSCRLFRVVEPLNLGLAVYDGFLCHDGGMADRVLEPKWNKSWSDHFAELEEKLGNPDLNIAPATLEGCLVKIADTMSYIGRDIEDAISLGILDRKQVPETILGTSNREILSVLARDLIKSSYGKDYIAISEECFAALKVLRKFNFNTIYIHPLLKRESLRVKRGYRILFEFLLEDLQKEGESSFIWSEFLKKRSPGYLKETSTVDQVIDYISGMTDGFFVKTLERLMVPQQIDLSC